MNPIPSSVSAEGDSRHLRVLEALEGHANVSQRTLAERLEMAVSRVNRVLSELMDLGHLEVVDEGVRPFAYRLTAAGERYRRRLRHESLQTVVGNFRQAQERIRRRLAPLRDDGVGRVVFYGAGEIMEVTLPLAEAVGLEIVGVVDDDPAKQGGERGGFVVQPPDRIEVLRPDGIIITTFRHAGEIHDRIGHGNGDGRGDGDGDSNGLRVIEL